MKVHHNIKVIGCEKRKPIPIPKLRRPNLIKPTTGEEDMNVMTPLPENEIHRQTPNEVVITLSTGKFAFGFIRKNYCIATEIGILFIHLLKITVFNV